MTDYDNENIQKALISGYVYGQAEHGFRIFALIFATLLLIIFDIVLWYHYFKSNLSGLLIFAVLFACFLIGLIFINLKIRLVDNLQFTIHDNRIINQSQIDIFGFGCNCTPLLHKRNTGICIRKVYPTESVLSFLR